MKKIAIAIISIVIMFSLLIGLLVWWFNPFPQTIMPEGYTCPAGKSCSATSVLECTTQTSQKVTFRTNALSISDFSNSAVWIAVDCIPTIVNSKHVCISTSNLNGYCKKSGAGGNTQLLGTSIRTTLFGSEIRAYNSKLYVRGSNNMFYEYVSNCSFATTSLTPTEPFKTNLQEIYSGPLYSCSRKIKINGLENGDTLSYSGVTPTPTSGLRGNTYSLKGGDSISSSGTGIFSVDYAVFDTPTTTCKTSTGTILEMGNSICTSTYVAESCVNENNKPVLKTQNAIPPQICRDGAITDAYTTSVDVEKATISPSENFVVNVQITNTPNNKDVKVTGALSTSTGAPKQTLNIYTGRDYPEIGKAQLTFDSLPVGSYSLKVSFTIDNIPYSKIISLSVKEGLILEIQTANPVQYYSSSNPVTFYIISTAGGAYPEGAVALDGSPIVDVKYGDTTIYNPTVTNPSKGKYEYTIKNLPNREDDLVVRARGCRSSYCTDFDATEPLSIIVKQATIQFADVNFKTNVCKGTISNTFKTVDSQGQPVKTTNSVTYQAQGGDKVNVPVSEVAGETGKYEFSITYPEAGLFTIRVTSTSDTLGSSQLDGGSGRTVNIFGGTSCGGDELSINWTMYLIIGGFIIAIGVFVWLTFIRKRK